MLKIKYAVPAAILLAGFLLSSTLSFGKPEYVKTTKKACTYCHVDSKAKPKELTQAGKYYKEHNSLEGYTETK
jgi:inorganic pyrophosphatase/exopolyphosphatase